MCRPSSMSPVTARLVSRDLLCVFGAVGGLSVWSVGAVGLRSSLHEIAVSASARPARSLRAVGISPSLQKLRYLVRHHPGEETAHSPGGAVTRELEQVHTSCYVDPLLSAAKKLATLAE